MSLRKREREKTEREALERVRGRVVSGIHSGHLDPGDRLPSYRQISAESGLDLRAVQRIYTALEQEGLVEVRGRAGVYVAAQERIGGRVLAETARWTVGVLREAWQRRIAIPAYPGFVRRCIQSTVLRCACIESTEDQLTSLCAELSEDFGLDTSPVHADELATTPSDAWPDGLPREVREADLLVTTAFHASAVRPLAASLGKPLGLIRLDPDAIDEVRRALEEREVTVICVDPRFLERLRLVVGGAYADRIRGLLVAERGDIARLDPRWPVLVSRAARLRLRGVELPPPALSIDRPVVSPRSAGDLIELIVRANLEAMKEESDR